MNINKYLFFQAKIDEAYQNQKTLEKPELALGSLPVGANEVSSSILTSAIVRQWFDNHETMPTCSLKCFHSSFQ